MKITLKTLRSLIRETLYVASAPKRFNLPSVEVEADSTREAGEKASDKFFTQHGVKGVDPFSIDVVEIESAGAGGEEEYNDPRSPYAKHEGLTLAKNLKVGNMLWVNSVPSVFRGPMSADEWCNVLAVEPVTKQVARTLSYDIGRFGPGVVVRLADAYFGPEEFVVPDKAKVVISKR